MGEQETWMCGCCCFTVVALIIGIFPFVFTTTSDTERGVVYSKLFARFEDEIIETGGFHTKPYNAEVIRWPRTEETAEFSKLICNSRDGLLIDMFVTFQFFADPAQLLALTKEYREYENWRQLMVKQAQSTVRNVCGDFIADQFQTERGRVAAKMEEDVSSETSLRYHAVVTKLQLRDVNRPSQYEAAVRDKENARSEIRLAENEEVQAITQAETTVDVALEEEIRLLDSAETEAEIKRNQSAAQRDGIIDRFVQLSELYSGVKRDRNLTVPGILTYISNEIFMDDVTIAVDTPAKITFRDDEL